MSIPYTITPRGVTLVIDNRPRTFPPTAPNFGALVDGLRKKIALDKLRQLADIPSFIAKATFGRVQIGAKEVRFDGERIEGVLAERLMEAVEQGHDVEPLALFMDRLQANPSETARAELYLFLESGNNPITPDGCFLAFKKVREDYRDIYTGTMDNSVGLVLEMDRARVNPDRHQTCAAGLHFCSWTYLSNYGTRSGSRVMIVKIDPADVVAIPSDYRNAKGRTWRYEVVGEVPEDEAAQFFSGRAVDHRYDGAAKVVGVAVDEDGDPVEDEQQDDAVEPDVEPDDSYQGGDYVDGSGTEEQQDAAEDGGTPDGSETGTEAEADLSFTAKDGRTFGWDEVLSMTKEHGQRGMSRLTGIPRTTIQEWLNAIREAGKQLED